MDELTLGKMNRDNQFDFIKLLFILNSKELFRNFIIILYKKKQRKKILIRI
jgi:hypothetical protein